MGGALSAKQQTSADSRTESLQPLSDERRDFIQKSLDAWCANLGYKDSTVNMLTLSIIRKSKFPQNPKRSVRFSGKRTKRSVQKRKARNTQKAETKVL